MTPSSDEEPRDLGFGAVVSRESRQRLLNRDGGFNVAREGLRFWESLSLYHALLTLSWVRFLLLLSGSYLLINALFAAAYLACGPGALERTTPGAEAGFLTDFFFSIHTFATIGYGNLSPVGLAANLIVTVESLFGLLWLALATGLLFARFSRPTAKILFSRQAVVSPYQEITAFQFRIANVRSSQIIELEAQVLYSRFEAAEGGRVRQYFPLVLERRKVVFFPLSWTVVHAIDAASPLFGKTESTLHAEDAEFLILLSGLDETFAQTVHARRSYRADEIVWNARFANVFNPPAGGKPLTIDVARLHDIEPAG